MKARAPATDWKTVALQLAARIPRERLEGAVLAWSNGASPRQTWCVAFSGGADSLMVLLLVWAHWPERRSRLQALHFDHRLRGAESRADATFCRRVCASLDVTLIEGKWSDAPRDPGEAEARAARMAFFREQARVLWLGHQQDDIAESILMRLARGSGTSGLAAPRPVQSHAGGRVHLRPLLSLKKSDVVAALRECGATWREDSSNAAGRFFRNRIRREVLPAWVAAAQRDALAGAARSRLLLEEDDQALETWLETLQPLSFRKGKAPVLDLTVLRGKPRALLRRALHRWLLGEPRVGEISRQAFDAVLGAAEAGTATRHSVGREGFAVTDGARLWFEFAGKPRRNFHRSAN